MHIGDYKTCSVCLTLYVLYAYVCFDCIHTCMDIKNERMLCMAYLFFAIHKIRCYLNLYGMVFYVCNVWLVWFYEVWF